MRVDPLKPYGFLSHGPKRWDKWRASINRKFRALRQHLPSISAVIDVVDLAFVAGLTLLGYGIHGYSPRLSFIIIGGLILLSIRPLIYWFIR